MTNFSNGIILFFALMHQSIFLCIGIYESKHIGKGIYPMPEKIMIKLSGILSDTERQKLIDYFTMQITTKNKLDTEKLNTYKNESFSQDNLFHTLLGLFDVKTEVYKKDMDILNDYKKH